MKTGISIVICCYNSAKRLPETLRHIARLNAEKIQFEIILIDNASTDNTRLVAKEEWYILENCLELKIIDESQPGLNYARRKGAEEAQFDWILFCDDDNWLDKKYLDCFYEISNAYPDLSVIGAGIACPVYEVTPNSWFYKHKHLCAIFSLRDEGVEEHFASKSGDTCWVAGAGMIIKKEVLMLYFNNNEFILTDRKGDSLSSGGDSDIINFVLKNRYKTGQFTKLNLQHYIPKNRLTKAYIKKLTKGMAFTHVLLTYKEKNKLIIANPKECLIKIIKRLIKLDYFGAQRIYFDYLGKKDGNEFIANLNND